MSLQRLVLVVNTASEEINIIAARRAVSMVMSGKARVEETSGLYIRTFRMTIPIPSVIRLEEYRYIPRRSRSVTRKAIMLRDRHSCQYCGAHGVPLTLDHVLPKSRRGPASWENLVACCYPCNNKKGARTPDEAGMTLRHKPSRIGIHAKHRLLAGTGRYPEWDRYMLG